MVFPTLGFILFFILVLSLNAWLFDRAAWRKALLIGASFWFCAMWDVRFVMLMAGVIVVAFLGGRTAQTVRYRTIGPVLSTVGLLALLAFFKYFNFFLLSLQPLLHSAGLERDFSWMQVVLPVGISFYVFQAISYVVDCRRRVIPAHGLSDVALYVSFFPQLVAGPIVRASTFLPQIAVPRRPSNYARAVAVLMILSGMAKKMLIANYIGTLLVDPVFARPDLQSTAIAWSAVLGYSVQIFCDFSGYSDIAIGIALLLGYRFNANFRQPYSASRFRDFWQRWHISLSSWIRDYLYIPFGGRQGSAARQALVMLVTMGLAGLWHGASWAFVLWGLAHGALIATERALGLSDLPQRGPSLWVGRLVVFGAVTLLWLPFRSEDWALFSAMLEVLGGASGQGDVRLGASVAMLVLVGLGINYVPPRVTAGLTRRMAGMPPELQAGLLCAGLYLLFAAAQDGVAPFIYFQF